MTRPGTRVLVVSAAMGAGHDAVAAELTRRLTVRGAGVTRADWLVLGGRRRGQALRRFYAGMLSRAPWSYDAAMRAWRARPEFFEGVTRIGASTAERAVERLARDADLVVATYNLAGQALGRLRAAGRIRIPVATVVTDPGPHPYWWQRGTDLHVVPVVEAVVPGRWDWAVADPLVAPAFSRVGGEGTRVTLTGGSWGAGGVETVARLLAPVRPVVLCGRDETLRSRLAGVDGVDARGWTPDVPAVLREASCLVDPAGGTSTWEALVAGVPVVAPPTVLAGHGRMNVEALARSGRITWARDDESLLAAVRAPVPREQRWTGVDAADLVLGLL